MPTESPKHRPHRVTTGVLIGAAIAVGLGVAGAAPAAADPSAFGTLSCGCHPKAPAGSPVRSSEIARGIRQSLADWSPRPAHHLSAPTG